MAGGNWWFLLPSLRAERIVCLGSPTPATLAMLAEVSEDVVVCAAPRQRTGPQPEAAGAKLPGVSFVDSSPQGRTSLAEESADVVFIAGRSFRRPGARRQRQEVARLLRPGGVVYSEFTPVLDGAGVPRLSGSEMPQIVPAGVLWLAPASGEMRLAAPLADSAAIAYLERRFLKRSIRRRALVRHPRRIVQRHVLANRLLPRRGALAGRPPASENDGPPRYIQRLAAESGLGLERHRWALAAPGEFSSQKVLFFLFGAHGDGVPDYVVKITRDRSLNARLENESRALGLIHGAGFHASRTLPRPVFFGLEHGLAVFGETAVDGTPFLQRTAATHDCPLAEAAIDWLVELGVATARPPAEGPGSVAPQLEALFDRFRRIYGFSGAHESFLASQIASLAGSEAGFPLVFQHGDPGPWNLLVTAQGEPAFLDWEAAEPEGMPLCDLFHFARSYGIRVSRAAGTNDPMRSFEELFLADSALGRLLVGKARRYSAETGLAPALVAPLFYFCWMQRALKEVTRLHPERLDEGRYVNLVRVSIDRRESPGLRRLFTLSADE